jgi:hypothetical protein
MPDLLIHRCRVRVLRRGGWSWGPVPRALLDQVLRWLPGMLAARFQVPTGEEGDVEMQEPLRINIPVKLDAQGRLHFRDPVTLVSSGPQVTTPLLQGPPHAPSAPTLPVKPHAAVQGSHSADAAATEMPAQAGSALVRLLQAWRGRGCLGQMLRHLSSSTLANWHDVLFAGITISGAKADVADMSPVEEALHRVLAQMGHPTPDGTLRCLHRLVLAVETAALLNRDADDVAILSAIERVLPTTALSVREGVEALNAAALPGAPFTSEQSASSTLDAGKATEPNDVVVEHRAARRASPSAAKASWPTRTFPARMWETQVGSALPFLMLGPLVEAGFFAAVAATLEVEELAGAWPTFATALAYKVLDLPDMRGRRGAAVHHDGATFAGCCEPICETAVTELAVRTRGKLSAPQAVIARALLETHPVGQPLLVHAVEQSGDWLLVELAGAFPIACTKDPTTLLDWHELVEGDTLLLPRTAMDPALVQRMYDQSVRFITGAPPTRGDSWRCLRSGHDRWWTNDALTPHAALVRQARRLNDVPLAATAWRTLGPERPTAPLAPNSDLDQTLTLAASLALGRIAWDLWNANGATDPLLTLTRFASLSARVQFLEDQVRVTVPMGRRSGDLRAHRLIEDVPHLPWLDGRTVVFHVG